MQWSEQRKWVRNLLRRVLSISSHENKIGKDPEGTWINRSLPYFHCIFKFLKKNAHQILAVWGLTSPLFWWTKASKLRNQIRHCCARSFCTLVVIFCEKYFYAHFKSEKTQELKSLLQRWTPKLKWKLNQVQKYGQMLLKLYMRFSMEKSAVTIYILGCIKFWSTACCVFAS